MTFLCDHSGKLFTKEQCTLKDVAYNPEAILATCQASVDTGERCLSAYTLQKAILLFYSKHGLYPRGLYSELPAVSDWALKQGIALKKLAPRWLSIRLGVCFHVSIFDFFEGPNPRGWFFNGCLYSCARQ
ncbi:unnamed protein product [Durusdinium trenchii]|uniref:Uncharacterized protein n=1 Tax=Durusdinium trenchii TaxID=1381693 RepID=A0ABP0PAE7_9DINO